MNSNFIWIDLSTFDLDKAKKFYHAALGWQFPDQSSEYHFAEIDAQPCAGLYEMPAFFQKIKMPSFWMSYISVDDIGDAVLKAEQLGGKIELEEDYGDGNIALIRDPSGAGFTCYQGSELAIQRDTRLEGRWCWTELWVSDINLVKEFYSQLFSWQIKPKYQDYYDISLMNGEKVGAIQVANESVKGSKQFWAVYFSSLDIKKTIKKVESAGGQVDEVYEHPLGQQVFVYDDQQAGFFLLNLDE